MLASAKAKQLLDRVLGEARKQGKAAGGLGEVTAVATLRSERGGHTRFAVNDVTQAAELERLQLIVELGLGRRRASATTNQLDGAAIEDVVARALRLARLSPESPEAMPPLGPQRYAPGKNAVDAATARAGAPARAAAAKVAIELARAAKLHIAGFYEHVAHSTSLASSAGLWAHHEGTTAHYSCSARTLDGTGSGSAGGAGWRIAELDGERYATTAIAKAKAAANPRRLEPGKYTVVLEPLATAALTRFVSDSLDARGAEEGRTFYSRPGTAGATRVGDKLFPEWITLTSDPADYATDGMPFDREGVPQRPVRWIDKGVLTGLPTDRYWAHERGAAVTGAPSGWGFAGGNATRDELIKGRRPRPAHLSLLLPGPRRSPVLARHRPHPQRRLPHRARRHRRPGEQLPLQPLSRRAAGALRRAGRRRGGQHRWLRPPARAVAAQPRLPADLDLRGDLIG